MVEIGGRPILWHIMNIYACQGINEFIVALGYKSDIIKDYFLNFRVNNNDVSIDLPSGRATIHDNDGPHWRVHLVDTGLHTQTGGRLRRLRKWLDGDGTFCFTYGDGVADIDLKALLNFHESHGRLATVTTVRAPGRFGRITAEGDRVVDFSENPETGEGWINGGFFVLNLRAIEYARDDGTVWECVGFRKERYVMTNKPPQDPPPDAKSQPASERHPLFGALKGLMLVAPDTDLTEPADPEWGKHS